jgi:ribose-phosphate pyrophosphokinase
MIQLMGADRIITLELHTNAIEGFYKIPLDPLSSHRLFIESIKQSNLENLCLCSPDFGGIKRLKVYKQFVDADIAVINKERLKPNQVAHMEIIGDVKDKNVIIIDDLVDTAGTLCKAADLVVAEGAASVQAYCTHGVLSGNALENIRQSHLKHICISDTVRDDLKNDKVKIVTCAPLLARAIQNLISNKSLSGL